MSGSEALLGLAVIVPLGGALLIRILDRRPVLRDTLVVAAAFALLGAVLGLFSAFRGGATPDLELIQPLPGLSIALAVEPLGMLFALVAATLYALTALYAVGYMRANDEPRQGPFHAWFALALAATMGVALSANLLTLFVFYEILTLSTWPLVAHHGDEKARKGGQTYIVVLLTSSVGLFLLALVWTWRIAGTLTFTPGGILPDGFTGLPLAVLLALYLFGVGKAAVMPVHRWLPAAMVAPTPVSALLHAVAVVKAGVFTILKILVYVFGADRLLGEGWAAGWALYVAGFSVVAASVVALRQDDLKRRLAYSTVSQLGYVTMAGLVLAPLSLVGAALHIAAHAVSKITLFFAAGAVHTAAHKTRVSELGGLGWRMPWTFGAFAVASLSLMGVPPTVGFLSKWYMLLGAWEVSRWTVLGVLTLSTLLNAAYFLPIVHSAFFKPESPVREGHSHGEAPLLVVTPLVLTAGLALLLFLFPGWPLDLARQMAGEVP